MKFICPILITLLLIAFQTEAAGSENSLKENDNVEEKAIHPSVWEAHWQMFMAILIFIAVAVLVTFLCCLCLKCTQKYRLGNKQLEKVVADEPVRWVEKEQATNTNALYSRAASGIVEKGYRGEPLPADEENGWIIPLDQMTQEELDQPMMPVSKL